MSSAPALKLITPFDNAVYSAPEEVALQAKYFDSFMTRHLLDAMPGMVVVLNRHRQIVFANHAFLKMSGRSSLESVLGRFPGDVFLCHVSLSSDKGCGSEQSCLTCGALLATVSGLAGDTAVQECTLTQGEDEMASNLTLRVWAEPVSYEGQNFTVLAGVDVSHEHRRLALERTFFHDILNLVGSIRGFAEIMEVDQDIDPIEVGRRIQLASQRVIDEVDTQRVLLAAEKGELQLDSQLLTSRDLLTDVLTLYEGQEVACQKTLKIADEVVNLAFIGDATLIRRILGNMVKNALEATPPGETVTLSVIAEEASLSFQVHNVAVIPEIYRQRIFQRDFSTKGSGRGLGTYSMKLLSHFISGEVFFVSLPEEGTTFFLRLPLLQD